MRLSTFYTTNTSFSRISATFDIKMSNNATPGDGKKATVVPIYKGGDRSVV